ncbi:zinc finger family protein [Dorcoceras hygrometricum]|uniref:RING-type E3 ubiquitin transferase n=1 Tax=Dorcoceras hygrometricum TaxID=472368 RepID=A0A2Z7DC41_9LAMI|nr:zinc finger family protein [Dorcoceras hygrometricum]
MASQESTPASGTPPPSLEELSTRGVTALLVPWILGMVPATWGAPLHDVAIFVHQPTRSITLVEGSLEIEAILREILTKEGHRPASKVAIEALPVVRVSEPGLECPICLSDYEVNGEVKEMPCRHIFHSGCIDKWLGIHGSCPVCRYSMPVEETKEAREDGRGDGLRIHVFFPRGGRDSVLDALVGRAIEDPGSGSRDTDGDSESPAQNTDISE